MAKLIDNSVYDAALDTIATADQLVLCAGQPSTYADATTDSGSGGNALGETPVTGADFTNADGDTNGRKVTVSAQTGITVDVTGTFDHVALVDDTGSVLLAVATVSSQSITAGGTVDVNAFDIEIADPT
nr:hypothetical protein 32 [bacterium]